MTSTLPHRLVKRIRNRRRAEPKITTWNHRVLIRETPTPDDDPDQTFTIIEAFYDHQGRIIAWGECHLDADTFEELFLTIKLLMDARTCTPLTEADLPGPAAA
jgi:hypothetical protein